MNASPKFPTSAWDGTSASRSDASVERHPDARDYDQISAEVNAVEADRISEKFKSLINDNVGAAPVGTPMYLKSTEGHADLAKADALSTGVVVGLVSDVAGIAPSAAGNVQTEGDITLTTAQWDTIAGTTGGLTPGVVYFLSAATAGKLTSTAPVAASSVAETVVLALSATTARIKIGAALVVHA